MTLGALAAASSSSVSNVEPGVLAFLVVAGIGVALVFLLRSMNKQFRKITPHPGPDAGDQPDSDQPDSDQPDGVRSDGAPAK